MKKKLPLIILVLSLLVVAVFGWTKLKSNKNGDQTTANKKTRIEEPTNVIPVEDRPYITITPLADGHNLSLTVKSLKKDADQVEYELEYQAGSLLQGAFGQLSLSSLPASTQILLGSCSAGGACTYHEDVQGGSLLTRFSGDEVYALKSRWKYIDNAKRATTISSQDAKFQLESANLASERYLIIFNTAGYPDGLKGQVISEVYSLTSSGNLSGSAKLSIRANEAGDLTIMGFDGNDWVEFETTSDDKTATADVNLMELYLVTTK